MGRTPNSVPLFARLRNFGVSPRTGQTPLSPMSLIFQFADSEVVAVTAEADTLRVRFSAATVRRDANDRGWMSGVVLALSGVTSTCDMGHAFGKVVEGRLRDGRDERASLALP